MDIIKEVGDIFCQRMFRFFMVSSQFSTNKKSDNTSRLSNVLSLFTLLSLCYLQTTYVSLRNPES